jgi:Flp pilus assembly protein TadD
MGTISIRWRLCAGFSVVAALGGCAGQASTELVQANSALVDTGEAVDQAAEKPVKKGKSVDNLLRLGADIEARGSLATALPLYQRAAADPGAGAPVLTRLADTYAKLGQDDEAITAYRRALALDPNYGPALLGLGGVLIRSKQTEDGLAALAKAAPLVNSAGAYSSLGVAHMMLGQPREALASLEQAHTMAGDDPDIASNLALAAALSGQRDRAIDLARRTMSAPGVQHYHRRNLILVMGLVGAPKDARKAVAGSLPAEEVDTLLAQAEKIGRISSPKRRALALGTVSSANITRQ